RRRRTRSDPERPHSETRVMFFRTRTLLLAALAGLGASASVQAQGYNNFRVPQNQAAFNAGATLGSAAGARAGFQAGAINTPYYAAGAYPTIQDPANGYLT